MQNNHCTETCIPFKLTFPTVLQNQFLRFFFIASHLKWMSCSLNSNFRNIAEHGRRKGPLMRSFYMLYTLLKFKFIEVNRMVLQKQTTLTVIHTSNWVQIYNITMPIMLIFYLSFNLPESKIVKIGTLRRCNGILPIFTSNLTSAGIEWKYWKGFELLSWPFEWGVQAWTTGTWWAI